MSNIIEISEPNALEHLRQFLVLFCTALALQILVNYREQRRFFKTRPARIYGAPPRLLGRFRLPVLSENQFAALGFLLIISLSAAAVGFFPQAFLLIALLCYFPYFNSITPLSYIQRKTNLIPLVLLILLFSPLIDSPNNRETAAWAIILIKLCIAQMYFSAGLQKLRHAGLRWADGKSLRAFSLENYLWADTESALAAVRHPLLCRLASLLILFFELSFWIIIFVPSLTFIYVIFAFIFHLGIFFTMRINYLTYLSPVYMIFFTDFALRLKTGSGI